KDYVLEALKPAKVKNLAFDTEKKSVQISVDEDQLSLAIGKKGQNARLTSRLTGWEINIGLLWRDIPLWLFLENLCFRRCYWLTSSSLARGRVCGRFTRCSFAARLRCHRRSFKISLMAQALKAEPRYCTSSCRCTAS